MFENVVIFGSEGKFGQVFCHRLAHVAKRTTGVDLTSGADSPTTEFVNFQTAPDVVREIVSRADLIAIMTPEDAAVEIVTTYLPMAPREAVAFDILSVKQPITGVAAGAGLTCSYVSVHPMFAPSTDFDGQNVVITEVCGDSGAEVLEGLFRQWGARTSRMTADEHDSATSLTQVACHAALLCFGLVCSRSKLGPETLRKVETPVSRVLLGLSARICSGDPRLYQLIQEANGEGPAIRSLLAQTMASINTGGQLGGEFVDVFDAVNSWLGEDAQNYVELAARAVAEDATLD